MDSQIAKYKLRKAKARLAYYSTIISLLLLLSTFDHGVTMSDLMTSLFILPLPLYFSFQSLKLYRKLKKLPIQNSSFVIHHSSFSFSSFISQPSFAFRLSLALLILATFTTFARTSTPDPTLTSNLKPNDYYLQPN